jgi:hypothetical protein
MRLHDTSQSVLLLFGTMTKNKDQIETAAAMMLDRARAGTVLLAVLLVPTVGFDCMLSVF